MAVRPVRVAVVSPPREETAPLRNLDRPRRKDSTVIRRRAQAADGLTATAAAHLRADGFCGPPTSSRSVRLDRFERTPVRRISVARVGALEPPVLSRALMRSSASG